jgi:hypothetical protein
MEMGLCLCSLDIMPINFNFCDHFKDMAYIPPLLLSHKGITDGVIRVNQDMPTGVWGKISFRWVV